MPLELAAALERRLPVFAVPATLDALSDRLSSCDSLHLISHGTFKEGKASLLLENPEGPPSLSAKRPFSAGSASAVCGWCSCRPARAQPKPGDPNVMSGLAPKLAGHAAGVVAMQDFVAWKTRAGSRSSSTTPS